MAKFRSILLLLILIIIFAVSVLHRFAGLYETYAHDRWSRGFGDPIENLAMHFPPRSDNEPATRLKQLAVRLGIEFTTPGDADNYPPIYKDAKREKLIGGYSGLLDFYIRKQLEKPNLSVDPPPEIVSSYLMDYRKELQAVRDHILNSPPILWRQDLNHWDKDKQPDSALPRLLAIVALQRTLVGRAVELASRQNFPESETYLDAGWKLNQALREHPDILPQLISLVIDCQWLGVIRKLPVDLDWTRKIAEHNYRKSFVKAFQVDAHWIWRYRDVPLSDIPILDLILQPYARICIASSLEKEREEIASLQSLNPCSLGYDDFEEITEPSKWNLVQPERWPNEKKQILGRLAKLEIDRELTAMIIRANHALLPAENNESSHACPDGIWALETLPNGSTRIQYASPLESPEGPRLILPTSFTVSNSKSSME
ncbi:MAG TPA: hypothetical protein VLH08_07545 [Acidobacteriota bacterium]|nr:hypothetical protein [Acidobacteriota bacterium]